jgi:hypothetical protein
VEEAQRGPDRLQEVDEMLQQMRMQPSSSEAGSSGA